MTGKTLAHALVDGCILYVSTTRTPSDADWNEYLDFLRTLLAERRPAMRGESETAHHRCLVLERGPGPSALQRKQLQAATEDHPVRVAVVVTSALARGVVTVLSWTTPGYKAFAPKELDDALSYLGYRGEPAARIQSELRRLQEALD